MIDQLLDIDINNFLHMIVEEKEEHMHKIKALLVSFSLNHLKQSKGANRFVFFSDETFFCSA